MRKVRVGMIGAGNLANAVHYPSLASIEGAEIAGICDIDNGKLQKTSDKYGVKRRYVNYKKMIEKEEMDAAYVIMPPQHLYQIVVDCLEKGLNIFIEKPPGVSSFQTKNLAWFADKYNCKTMVGFNRRFIPLMRKAKKIVEERGALNQCTSVFYKNMTQDETGYYRGEIDMLTCDVIHAVDALRWMGAGEVRKLCSSVRKIHSEYDNSFNVFILFDNGKVGFLMSNFAAGSRIHTFEIHGRGISALVNPDKEALIYSDNKAEPETISTYDAAGGSRERHIYYGFYHENKHFIECILKNEEPETNFRDAVKTMELVDSIYANRE